MKTRKAPTRKSTAKSKTKETAARKSTSRRRSSARSLTDPRVQKKLQQLLEAEVQSILQSENVLLAVDDQTFQIKDYTIEVQEDKVACKRKDKLLRDFHTKQCAVLYVLNLAANKAHIAWKLEDLDDQIYKLKTKEDFLKAQAPLIFKKDQDRGEVLYHKLTEIKARLSKVLGTVKKYSFLAKYQKGITV